MPESNVPFRTAPVTASDGIHETLVTDDSTRMLGPPPQPSRARVRRRRNEGEGASHPAERKAALSGGENAVIRRGGGQHPRRWVTAHLVATVPTIWNGGSWGTAGSPCSSPTTTSSSARG